MLLVVAFFIEPKMFQCAAIDVEHCSDLVIGDLCNCFIIPNIVHMTYPDE